jgi:hypothetical protein
MGDRKRIGSLFGFLTNRARNRMAIRTQIRTRVDGLYLGSPLQVLTGTTLLNLCDQMGTGAAKSNLAIRRSLLSDLIRNKMFDWICVITFFAKAISH